MFIQCIFGAYIHARAVFCGDVLYYRDSVTPSGASFSCIMRYNCTQRLAGDKLSQTVVFSKGQKEIVLFLTLKNLFFQKNELFRPVRTVHDYVWVVCNIAVVLILPGT